MLSGTDNNETPASQLTYKITTQPTHGTLVQSTTSPDTFTYTPAAGYLGADSFGFTVTDTGNPPGNLANAKTSAPATVSLAVMDPAPVGVPVSYTARENVPLNVPVAQGVLASDTDSAGDPLTATLATTVSHGTLVLNSNGSFTYTPVASFTGTDSFTYVPHGTYVAGSPTKVTITVGQGAGPPPPPAPPAPPHVAVSHSTSSIAPAVASTAVSFKTATSVTPPAAAPAAAVAPISPTPPAPPPQAPSARHASAPPAPAAALSPTPPPKPVASNVDPYLNAAGLLSVPDPIVLRDYTSADDASFTLMLPASPQIAQLPEAFALAAQRLAARPQAIITFVDPVTGQAADDAGPTDQQDAPELAWLLLDADGDANMGAVASQIRWDSPTP